MNIANKKNDFEFKKKSNPALTSKTFRIQLFSFLRIIPLHFYGERPKSHDIPKRMYTYRGKIVQGKKKPLSVQQLLYFPFKKAVPIIFSVNTFQVPRGYCQTLLFIIENISNHCYKYILRHRTTTPRITVQLMLFKLSKSLDANSKSLQRKLKVHNFSVFTSCLSHSKTCTASLLHRPKKGLYFC